MGRNRAQSLFFAYLVIILSSPLAYTKADRNAKVEAPIVNKVYRIQLLDQMSDKAQRTESTGYVYVDEKGKWHLHIQFLCIGATFFSQMSQKKIDEIIAQQSAPDIVTPATRDFFSQRRVSSIQQIPALAKRIRGVIKRLEDMYTTDFLESTFDVIFPEEDNLISKEARRTPEHGDDMLELVEGFQGKTLDSYPLIWLPHVPGNYLSPRLWLPWVREEYAAHELGHLLAKEVANDGFLYEDYPAEGIMNDGATFAALTNAGGATKITREDWNYILSKQRRAFGLTQARAQFLFRPNFSDFKQRTDDDAEAVAQRKVERWKCAHWIADFSI